ncbi:MAG: tetratricopeptide repeat protein [Candidatus Pacebacteria bacterium]|nr:tetratricopeptide repeat protein [Candidatus Paceibacterota bacterium]
MNIIEYIILGFSVLLTLGWCLNVRGKAKNEQATEKSMELLGFLMTVSIVLVLLLRLSPFHLLWMLPASFILGLLSAITPLRFLWIFSSIYFSFWYIGVSNEGRKFYIAGDYNKAIESFKKEIDKKPSSAEAYFNLGLAYGKISQHDKEITAYQEAIRLKPNKPEPYLNLGLALNDKGDKDKAIEALKQAIELRPDYLKAHYTICQIYSRIGDRENARKEFEIVKKADGRAAADLASFIKEA